MNRKIIISYCIFLVSMVLITGCLEEDMTENKFVGTWNTNLGTTIIFQSDQTCVFNNLSGNWELSNNNTIYINTTLNDGKNIMRYNYNFSDDYTKLDLVDFSGRIITCTKVD